MAEEHVDAEPVVEHRGEEEGQWGGEPRRHAQQKNAEEQNIHASAEATHTEITQELDRQGRVRLSMRNVDAA